MATNHNLVVCGAIRANGQTCTKFCKPGFTKCYLHGGAGPSAKAKAEHTMALLRVPALEVLHNVLETLNTTIDQFNEFTCAACGYPKGDVEEKEAIIKACIGAVRAAQTVLDRTGLGPTSKLEVRQTDGDMDVKSLTDGERERMMSILGELRSLKAEIRTRQLGGTTPQDMDAPSTPPQIM